MQIGIDSFAATFDDAGLVASPAVRLAQLLERIEHADHVGLDVFGIGEHHRRGGAERGRPGPPLPTVRDARSDLSGASRDGRGPRLVDRSLPALWLRPQGLRRAVRREAGPPADSPRERARHLVRCIPAAPDRPGGLSAAGAGLAADLARRRWNAGLV